MRDPDERMEALQVHFNTKFNSRAPASFSTLGAHDIHESGYVIGQDWTQGPDHQYLGPHLPILQVLLLFHWVLIVLGSRPLAFPVFPSCNKSQNLIYMPRNP
jgi:hypothetical protein